MSLIIEHILALLAYLYHVSITDCSANTINLGFFIKVIYPLSPQITQSHFPYFFI